jgi:hypothetical protein
MTSTIRTSFRNIPQTGSLDAYIRLRGRRLLRGAERVVSCRVDGDAPHRHKQNGRHFRVSIEVDLPRRRIVVDRCPDDSRESEDAYAAIDAAFDHAVRRLHEAAARDRRPLRPALRGE